MMKISVLWKSRFGGGHKPFLIHQHGIVSYTEMKARVTRACASIRRLKIPVGAGMIVLLGDRARASAAFIAANLEGHGPIMLPFDIGAGETILPHIRLDRTAAVSAGSRVRRHVGVGAFVDGQPAREGPFRLAHANLHVAGGQ